MRIWFKLFKDNHLLKDTVVCEYDFHMTRTEKIFHALSDACIQFDLSQPIWLDTNIREFKRHNKTRFIQDNFVEIIDFDFMEIHIIEE